jgi:hypothetical protein
LNYEQIRNQRLELIRNYAKKIWEKLKPNGILEGIFDEKENPLPVINYTIPSSIYGFVYRTDIAEGINVVIWGSGSFSTGRMELEEWKRTERRIPVNYVAIVSNNEESNAKKVAEAFGLPLVQIDFREWYRDNYDKNSKNPIKETGLFFPPGTELPEDIEFRFKVREEFEWNLIELLEEKVHTYEDTQFFHSLRGYNFPIIHSHGGYYDDTHPADLSYVDENGNPLYPGWQSGATKKMIEDGHKTFRSSLIWVHPTESVENLQKVDSGELLALSEGINYEGKNAKELQNIMKMTEDSMLVALKAWGLFPTFWGFTHEVRVPYRQLDDTATWREEHNIIVGKRERSGIRAFGQNLKQDLETLLYDISN